MLKRLSINLATRGRPDLLAYTIEATLKNIASPHTILMVSCDADDDAGIKAAHRYLEHVQVSVMPREDSLGEKYNRVLTQAPADAYLAMVDYAPMITPQFDLEILEAGSVFLDGYAMIYGPRANRSFPCINAVTHKLARAMGGIYPGWFPYWFVDHWFHDVGQMINRIVDTRVTSDDRRRPDTMERREPAFWATFFDATHAMRLDAALHVVSQADFDSALWTKGDVRRMAEVVRKRSTFINDCCRAMSAQIENPSRDERYARIKARAVALLAQLNHPAAQAA